MGISRSAFRRRIVHLAIGAATTVGPALPGALAFAQPAPPATNPLPATPDRPPEGAGSAPTPNQELSPEEMAEIERATGSDAGKLSAQQASTEPSDASSSGGNVLGIIGNVAFLPDISLILDLGAKFSSYGDAPEEGASAPSASDAGRYDPGFGLGAELELALGKSVDPYFRLDTNISFSPDGVELEEAYATTLSLPWNLQARAGMMLTQFGRLNSTHPHAWTFADRPLMLAKVFGSDGNRGLGAELSWLTPLPWYLEIIGSTTLASGEQTARSFYGADSLGIHSPIDFQNTLAIKQFFDLSEDWSLLWGLSAANGPNSSGDDARTDVFGTDLYVKFRPITHQSFTIVSLQAEWLYRRRSPPGAILQDSGGYAQLFWRFDERWGTAARYEFATPTYDSTGAQVVDPLDPAETAAHHRASLNLSFWPTEFSQLRLQTEADFPRWLDLPRFTAMLTGEVGAGVHGAHKF